MPSESAAGRRRTAPPDVAADLRRFESLVHAAAGQQTAALHADPSWPSTTIDLLVRFGLLVHAEAEDHALIAKGDRAHLFTRHVLDSLGPLNLFAPAPCRAIDIGSGGGLPGIPLAIVWPETHFTLLESRERKAGFLERAVRELELRNVSVVCERLEDLGRTWNVEPLDAILIRAVGGIDKLLRGIATAAAPGCRWVYFLGAGRDAVSIQDPLEALGLDSEVVEGRFGGRLLTGLFQPKP